MADLFKRTHYKGRDGAPLQVHLENNTTVELTQVEYNDTSTDQVDSFAVAFEGPEDQPFDQGMYSVEHSEAGTGELFLVPVISDKPKTRRYELVVSSLKEDNEE